MLMIRDTVITRNWNVTGLTDKFNVMEVRTNANYVCKWIANCIIINSLCLPVKQYRSKHLDKSKRY